MNPEVIAFASQMANKVMWRGVYVLVGVCVVAGAVVGLSVAHIEKKAKQAQQK